MRNLNLLIGFILFFLFFSCKEELPDTGLKSGLWREGIHAQNNRIPFNFETIKKY